MYKEKEQEATFKFENNPYPGFFICLEGIDGSGKSTQTKKIKEFLTSQGKDFVITKEHNEKYLKGKEIQEVLDHKRKVDSSLEFQEMYVVNRQEHLKNLIIPSLREGKIVLTDRYFWSTIAYGSLGVKKETLIEINKDFIAPDLTIFLGVQPGKAMEKLKSSRSSIEIFEKLEKLEIISQTYKWLTLNYGQQIITVDGEQLESEITSQIINLITKNKKFNQVKIHENIN